MSDVDMLKSFEGELNRLVEAPELDGHAPEEIAQVGGNV